MGKNTKTIELILENIEKTYILLETINGELNASERAQLRQIKDYLCSMLNKVNKLLAKGGR